VSSTACGEGGKLLAAAGESIGLPLKRVCGFPATLRQVSRFTEARMALAMQGACEQGIRRVAFGDILLEDLRLFFLLLFFLFFSVREKKKNL